jgi:hypothetical protein
MLIRFLLVTVNLLLGAQLVALATKPVEPTPAMARGPVDPGRSGPPAVSGDAVRPDLAAAYERRHAVTRPLFSPDRRPWQPRVQVAEREPEPAPVAEPEIEADFVLIGIGFARGEARALLTNGAGEALGWVAEGDTISDWTVSAISERSVKMAQAEREVSLSLHAEPPGDPGADQ